MSKPVAIPNTFATATTVIPLSNLDGNFTAVATSINSALTYSNYAADTGAADAYVVTFTGLTTTYAAGLRIQFKAANANTGASTINVNAQGTKSITFQNAAALTAGIIAANSIVDVMYDGTQFLLMNDPAGLTGGDVVGPASATDNAVVRFDGTTGKVVQNSVVTIADSTGDVAGVGALTMGGNLTLSGGTANGVLYLNGSKVATSGSALTFDGTNLLQVNAAAGKLRLGVNTSDQFLDIYRDNGSGASVYNAAQGSGFGFHVWQVANTEQMRLTSTGLKVGTTSDFSSAKVVTDGGGIGILNKGLLRSSTNGVLQVSADPNNAYASSQISFDVDGSTVATLDSSGNLGLGVTPSAWNTYTALQVKTAALWSGNSLNSFASLTGNVYYQGGYKYIASDYATEYYQYQGAHVWRTAPSGTAGNAISFTQAMTLDASGLLAIGRTAAWDSNAVLTLEKSGVAAQVINSTTNTVTLVNVANGNSSVAYSGTASNHPYYFITNNTERARITSGGEVYIAGTTDQGVYNLQVNGTGVWGAGAYVNGSDERLKDNIQTLNDGLAVVSQLRPVTFQYKPEHSKDQSVQPGFIAQELQQTMAGKDYVDGVVKSGPEYLNVAYQNLIPILTKAIQEQQALITSLTARVALLEGN